MVRNHYYVPGPGTLLASVAAAQGAGITPAHNRDTRDLHKSICSALRKYLGTELDVYLLSGTTTAAMEAAAANVMSPGEKALVVRGGHGGNRWADILKEYGAMVRSVDVEWGRAVNPKLIAERLTEDKENEIRAVFATFVDDATGVANDIRGIGEALGESPALFVVDGAAGIGAMDFRMEDWGVDVALGVSYGTFMAPPGVAFLSLSRDAWKVVERARCPRYYLDLRKYRAAAEIGDMPFTTPTVTLRALRAALDIMEEEGLQPIIDRHERLGRALRAAATALTLRLFPLNPANTLTVIRPPDEIGADDLRTHVERLYGVAFGDGVGQLKDRVIRIAHAGAVGSFDILTATAALEMGLADKGFVFEAGAGVAAAEKILKEL